MAMESLAQIAPDIIADELDTSYIAPLPNSWSLRAYMVNKYLSFSLRNSANGDEVRFTPSSDVAIGLGFTYKDFNLDLGVNLLSIDNQDQRPKRSDAFDFTGSLMLRNFLIDAFLQIYNGYYVDNAGDAVAEWQENDPFPIRDDIRNFAMGFNIIYVFNGDVFSTRAVYMGNERQRRSAGSPMVGFDISAFNSRADSSITSSASALFFNEQGQYETLNIISLGISAGYGYTFILPYNFFISLSLMPGLIVYTGDYRSSDKWYTIGDPAKTSFNLISKNAVGYNSNRFYTFFSVFIDNYNLDLNFDNELSYDQGKLKLVFGYRFGNFKS